MTRHDQEHDFEQGSDYLWDGTGPADAELAELEQALAPLRHDRAAPEAELAEALRAAPPRARRTFRRPLAWLLAACALGGASAWIATRREPRAPTAAVPMTGRFEFSPPSPSAGGGPGKGCAASDASGWSVAATKGAPSCSGAALHEGDPGKLAVGQWIVTDAGSSAQVAVADIGRVELGPSSELRLVDTGENGHRAELRRGIMHAVINAPPRLFVVDTPTSHAVDLGCRYSLEVLPEGETLLKVERGWVSLEGQSFGAYVKAGSQCRTSKTKGVGLPRRQRASAELVAALDALEAADPTSDEAAADEAKVLAAASADDRGTLWHVLERERVPARREAVYRRMIALGARPAAWPHGVMDRDPLVLDAWGRDLGVVPPS